MKITIAGHHMDIGKSMTSYIEDSITNNVTRYFDSANRANVSITKEKNTMFATDILVFDGTGKNHMINASALDYDPYKSFDIAASKLFKQLRRYKNKIQSQKNRSTTKQEPEIPLLAPDYTIAPHAEYDEDREYTQADEDLAPAIIAQTQRQIEKMSVSDAVMRMDMLDLNAYLFLNSKTSALNMVCYRKDGNISWVDIPADLGA